MLSLFSFLLPSLSARRRGGHPSFSRECNKGFQRGEKVSFFFFDFRIVPGAGFFFSQRREIALLRMD